mmetsp:Transcript_67716/g.180286  ORF Transcript_67716/g.180286 Transcript_67716/m.180286 type:complete len:977 (+) Transcript_67716:64-2994(+)
MIRLQVLWAAVAQSSGEGASNVISKRPKDFPPVTVENVSPGLVHPYELRTSGRCEHFLESLEACQAAAHALGLDDVLPDEDKLDGDAEKPRFCYFDGTDLKWNYLGNNKGDCSDDNKCLCIKPPAAEPVRYEVVLDGECYKPITTIQDCAAAAAILGFLPGAVQRDLQTAAENTGALRDNRKDVVTAVGDGNAGVPYDPPYCYYEEFNVKFNGNGKNTGPCTAGDRCICIAPPPAPPPFELRSTGSCDRNLASKESCTEAAKLLKLGLPDAKLDAQPSASALDRYKKTDGLDVTGNTLAMMKQPTAAECAEHCFGSSLCVVFTYASDGTCTLKSEYVGDVPTPTVQTYFLKPGDPNLPPGCYVKSGELFYNEGASNEGKCTADSKCLCGTFPIADYELVTNGKCETPLKSAQDCTRAAKYLVERKGQFQEPMNELKIFSARDDGQEAGEPYDPPFCYVERIHSRVRLAVKFNPTGRNSGVCSGEDVCLCGLSAPFETTTEGKCATPLKTMAECNTAAEALGLIAPFVPAVDDELDRSALHPTNCYVNNGKLKFNAAANNRGGCTVGNTCVCGQPPQATPPPPKAKADTVTCPGTPLPCSGKGYCDTATGTCWCAPGYKDSDCSGEAPLMLDIGGFSHPDLQDARGEYKLEIMYLHVGDDPNFSEEKFSFITFDPVLEGWAIYQYKSECLNDRCFWAWTGPGSLTPPITGYSFGAPNLNVYTQPMVFDDTPSPAGGALDPNTKLPLDPLTCCRSLVGSGADGEDGFKHTNTLKLKVNYKDPIYVPNMPHRGGGKGPASGSGYDMGELCGPAFAAAFDKIATERGMFDAPKPIGCRTRGLEKLNGYYIAQPRYVHSQNNKYWLMPTSFVVPGKRWVFMANVGQPARLQVLSEAFDPTLNRYLPPTSNWSPNLFFTIEAACRNHITNDACAHLSSFCDDTTGTGTWVQQCCRSTCSKCTLARGLCTLPPTFSMSAKSEL